MSEDKKETQLNEKDRKFREFALHGNQWKLIFTVCIPLAAFQLFQSMFNILDTMMASHVSSIAVSAVAYLSQIQSMIAAVGTGLAAGSTLKISEAYGAGDYEMVKKRLSTLVTICVFLSVGVLVMIPFTPLILKGMGTPQEFISIGTTYFSITLLSTVLGFFNNVYIAIERSRGNSKRILRLNMIVITMKLSITAFFVYGLSSGVTMIAAASVISQSFLFLCAIRNLFAGKDAFSFSAAFIAFRKNVVLPMLTLSFPVIVEKIAFAFGKTIVNSMSKNYGATTVGALGISNNINGLCTSLHTGIQDGGSAIISQQRGGGEIKRAIETFWKIFIFCIGVGVVMFLLLNTFINQISWIFANSNAGFDTEFQKTIIKVFQYESWGGCVPLGINAAIMALLFGFGETKWSLFCNFCRVFVYRIPILWALQHYTTLGSDAVGIVMAVSNTLTAVTAFIVGMCVLHNIKKELKTEE